MDEDKAQINCRGCDSTKAYLIYEPRYKGFLGKCPECGGSWPES